MHCPVHKVELFFPVIRRVNGFSVDPEFKVKMRSGGSSCGTDGSYLVSHFNGLPYFSKYLIHMSIHCAAAFFMLYHNVVSVSCGKACAYDGPVSRGQHRCPSCRREVYSGVLPCKFRMRRCHHTEWHGYEHPSFIVFRQVYNFFCQGYSVCCKYRSRGKHYYEGCNKQRPEG